MRNLFKIKSIILIAIFSVGMNLNSCKKNTEPRIPYVPINCTINLSLPLYQGLQIAGSYIYINNQGSKGLIVFNTGNGFVVFDRHCTHNPLVEESRVSVQSGNIFAKDSICGSTFTISDGLVVKGPAVRSLQKYAISQDGNILTITN